MKITDFHENHRIGPKTAISTKMLVSQKGAPRKHQETVTFIKGSGAGGGGSWVFAENMEIPEIRRKWQKNAEILEFRQKREKTGNRGNGKTADSRKPGAPSPAPLADRRITKPRVQRRCLIKIRHAFVANGPKCAPFSIQLLDKRQVL